MDGSGDDSTNKDFLILKKTHALAQATSTPASVCIWLPVPVCNASMLIKLSGRFKLAAPTAARVTRRQSDPMGRVGACTICQEISSGNHRQTPRKPTKRTIGRPDDQKQEISQYPFGIMRCHSCMAFRASPVAPLNPFAPPCSKTSWKLFMSSIHLLCCPSISLRCILKSSVLFDKRHRFHHSQKVFAGNPGGLYPDQD